MRSKHSAKGVDWDSPSIDWNESESEIARRLGVTRSAVRSARASRGIPVAVARGRPVVRHWSIHDTKRLTAIRAIYCADGNFMGAP